MGVENANTQPRTVLSDAECRAGHDGVVCLACRGRKSARHCFCPTCRAALTLPMRWQLDRGPDDFHFAANFRAALRHLALNPVRMRRFAKPGELPYRSVAEFEADSYRFLGYATCPVPRCSAQILWFRAPDGRRMRINESDLQVHKPVCADPEYFERKRGAQTSAKKRKRAS